jgi:NCS2 family nucleobase:cation symporter-2
MIFMEKFLLERLFLLACSMFWPCLWTILPPILIVTGVVHMPPGQVAALVQAAMIIAGVGSLLQMFPLGPLGSGLPVIMGISFTFVSVFCMIGAKYGYGAILGAALVGGILEGTLWLTPAGGAGLLNLSYQLPLLQRLGFPCSALGQIPLAVDLEILISGMRRI